MYFRGNDWEDVESLVLPEHLDDRLEREPLRDVLAASQHLAELGTGEFLDRKTLFLGDVGGDVALLVGVHDVERRHRLHAELGGVRLGEVLRVVRAVEVLAVDGGLRARHVSSDDEVRASVVLADDHVLDRLARAGHVHGVREVRPANLGVVHLRRERLVGVVAHQAGDVVVLRGTHRGVHERDRALAHVVRVERAREELVVRAVNRVAALERHHVLALGEHVAHLRRGGARERTRRDVQALHLASDVVLAALHGDHGDARVLDGGGAVAHLRLEGLVRLPLALHGDHRDVLPLVLQKHFVAHGGFLAIGIEHDGHAEQQVRAGQTHLLHAVRVRGLVHETSKGRETARREKLDVARVAVGELQRTIGGSRDLRLLGVGDHQVHELAAVGGLNRRRRERAGVEAHAGLSELREGGQGLGPEAAGEDGARGAGGTDGVHRGDALGRGEAGAEGTTEGAHRG
mmetsp:Transcript_8393/g.35099  ORF Transcript_8393/g.35099 Transcript_8393/m.35099 type:complete len:460 (-) Transcript_8393:4-1383(-)